MGDVSDFYEESLNFNWEMLESNPNYYIEMKSLTSFQKLDELYDMYVYFLEREEYEKCETIKINIETIRNQYHDVIRGKSYDRNRDDY